MTIAFDLDATICVSIRKNHPEDILKVKPFLKMVQLMRDLKNRGHKIIIFTRRGNLTNAKQLTYEWLSKYDIPFDELIIDKPHYHIFIEDRALSPINRKLSVEIIEEEIKKIQNNMNKHKYYE